MSLQRSRIAAFALFAALLALLYVRGIAPAVQHVDTDFPNYLTAAKIVAHGGPAERLYDDAWFQEQMRQFHVGNPENGKFAPFPPPTALLLVPLASLQPLQALRVMTALSLLCLALSAVLLASILGWRQIDAAIFMLLSGYAVFNTLRFGQPYALVAASCILGYYAYIHERPLLAGLCFGIFVPVKYFPVVILVYFAFRREWRVVLGGAICIAAVTATSIAILGWQLHEIFLSSVLGNHLVARLSLQDPFTASFQSFDTLSRRLLVFDSSLNPQPWLELPALQPIVLAVTKIAIAATVIAMLVRLSRSGERAVAPSVGILGVATLLLAPATATYHFVLLWLPVGLLFQYFMAAGAKRYAWLILGAYALMGFLPYGHTGAFEGRGGLAVLAFPRLWLLLAMFAICARYILSESGLSETGLSAQLRREQ